MKVENTFGGWGFVGFDPWVGPFAKSTAVTRATQITILTVVHIEVEKVEVGTSRVYASYERADGM